MRNQLRFGLMMLAAISVHSCSSDDKNPQPTIALETNITTDRYKPIELVASPTKVKGITYAWYLITQPETKLGVTSKKELLGQENKLLFIRSEEGDYHIELDVITSNSTQTYQTTVSVVHEVVDYSSNISKVYDFLPAVGQFTNDLPKWSEGVTAKDMCKEVEKNIANEAKGMITLGGFGGYVIFGFDHSVVNKKGLCDIRIKGNAFWANANPNSEASTRGGSCEPGIVSVSIDSNHNGLADDQWFEIAGSEYNREKTIHNYSITYYRPEKEDRKPSEKYIKWTDSKDGEGWIVKNTFHLQSYYPLWLEENSYELKGTKLGNNGIDESGQGTYWVLYSYPWGYVDNAPNNDPASAIDLDWAVDEEGNYVHLPYVDFIKVHSATHQVCGWLGETSTEISGAIDLHLAGVDITTAEAQQYETQL